MSRHHHLVTAVAPYAGAWIEIYRSARELVTVQVAPYAGAWIEIPAWRRTTFSGMSLPTRERGLK